MKRVLALMVIVLAVATSCTKETTPPPVKVNKAVYIVNGGSETIDIFNVETDSLDTNVIVTGNTPNSLKKFGDYLYLVNSGFQGVPTIQKIDYHSNIVVDSFVMPQGSNPWDITWDGSNFYVTSYTYNRVYKLNSSGAIVDSADAGIAPAGITFFNGKIYVVASFYDLTTYTADTGYLYVFNTNLQKLDSLVLFVNPTLIADDGSNIIVAGGDYTTGGGNLWKISPDSLVVAGTLALTGVPGALVVKGGKAYLTGYTYYPTVVNLATMQVLNTYTNAPASMGFMGIDVNTDASKIYVAVASWTDANYLWIIDAATGDTSSVELGNAKGSQIVKYLEVEE